MLVMSGGEGYIDFRMGKDTTNLWSSALILHSLVLKHLPGSRRWWGWSRSSWGWGTSGAHPAAAVHSHQNWAQPHHSLAGCHQRRMSGQSLPQVHQRTPPLEPPCGLLVFFFYHKLLELQFPWLLLLGHLQKSISFCFVFVFSSKFCYFLFPFTPRRKIQRESGKEGKWKGTNESVQDCNSYSFLDWALWTAS